MKKIIEPEIKNYIGCDLLFKQLDDNGKETGEQRTVRLVNNNSTKIFGNCVHNGKVIHWEIPINLKEGKSKSNIYLLNNF